ncbi:hypothetical protein AAEJ42_23020, partial [Shewanella algae]|uniref:hypothetical protein n=1 Tax=Shewanella algae TaxID=38313 RepID=UPI00313EA2DD
GQFLLQPLGGYQRVHILAPAAVGPGQSPFASNRSKRGTIWLSRTARRLAQGERKLALITL